MSRNTKFIFKLFLTLTFCAVIAFIVDWSTFWRQVRTVHLGFVSVAFCLMLGAQAISAYKWKLLLSLHGVNFNFGELHRYYYTAMFLNNFLPTSIGGDGYRIYKTLENDRSKTSAVVAILMERITGLAALLILGLGGALIGYSKGGGEIPGISVLFGVICALVLVALGITISGRVIQKTLARSTKPIARHLEHILSHASDYQQQEKKSIKIVFISFLFQCLAIVRYSVLVFAVGATCPLWGVAIVVSMSTLVSILPLSINGIGLLDGSFVFLIGFFGVGAEAAILLMILSRILLIPISLTGAVLYVFDKRRNDVVN